MISSPLHHLSFDTDTLLLQRLTSSQTWSYYINSSSFTSPTPPPVFPLDPRQAIDNTAAKLDLSTTVIPNFTERKLYNRFLIHIEGEERVGRAGALKDGTKEEVDCRRR